MVAPSLVTRLDPTSFNIVAIIEGKERTAVLVPGQELLVGTGDDCGLRIDEPTVSRHHVRLSGELAGVRVVDQQSTNGTFYEGAQIHDVTVPIGAKLKLGNMTLHLRPKESELRREGASGQAAQLSGLVAEDARMREMLSVLKDIAKLEATVIVEGETGTGKELVAQALHEASPRASKPFVVFDCTAIPKDLVESSLFGHVKGAFTGATATRQGAFRRAHGGTIFLDEIGELPLELQPKLLRVLESRTVQAVGGDEPEKVDVRVVCATNRDLKAEVKAGRFREDLYYRLAVVKVQLPALRDRTADIEVLAHHFAQAFREQNAGAHSKGGDLPKLEGFARLRDHNWPGNVRELRNLVEQALSLWKGSGPVDLGKGVPDPDPEDTDHDRLRPTIPSEARERVDAVRAAVADALASPRPFKDAKALVVESFERAFLEALMQKAGNLSRASNAAQMDRKHLRELLRRYGLWSEAAGPGEDP
jgi:DNA-binding NtrC family response regulator